MKSRISKPVKITLTAILAVALTSITWTNRHELKNDPFAVLRHFQPHDKIDTLRTALSQLSGPISAHASNSTLPYNAINALRSVVGMNIGYSSHANYVALVCSGVDPGVGGQCDGPPESGIIGAVTNIINTLPSVGTSVGINSCADVPASGSKSGTDSSGNAWTLNFQTPTHKIPATWTNGGTTFQKRIGFTLTLAGQVGTKVAYEFNCGDAAGYAAINMPMSNPAGTFVRKISIYGGPYSTSLNEFEVFMSEYSATLAQIRGAAAFRVQYNKTTSTFNLWGIAGDAPDNLNLAERFIAAGNYSTGKASVFANIIATTALTGNANAVDVTTLSAITDAGHDTVDTSTTFDFLSDITTGGTALTAGQEWSQQGCIDFSAPTTAATSATLCTGFPLTAATDAPSVDANGKFSITWAFSNLGTILETL